MTVYSRTPTSRRCSRRRATSSRAARWSSRKASSAARRPGRRLHVRAGLRRRACCRTCGATSTRYSTVAFDNYPGAGAAATSRWRSAERAMNIRGVFIEDTFAEAFTMRAARVVDHRPQPALGARGGAQADRLRHLGHRLQVRGGDRARARAEARRPTAGPASASCCMTMGKDDLRQAADRADRPDRAHLPHDGLLRRAARRARPGGRRLGAALLRRRLPGQQGDRRASASGGFR